jgi:hypothetical protein
MHLALAFAGAVIVKVEWEHLQRRWAWWPHWNSADLLAIIAIAFAIVQFLDARHEERALGKQENRMIELTNQIGEQAGKMESITLSMSTRFAGPFPENLKEIVDLISKAHRHLKVIVDFPGYGQYSAPAMQLDYRHKLELARSHDVAVQIICYNETLASQDRLDQFPDDLSRFNDRDMKRFEQFCRYRKMKQCSDFAGLRQLLKDHDVVPD